MTYYYWKAEILKEECEKIISEFDISMSIHAAVGYLHGTEGLYPEEIEVMKKEGRWDYLHNKSKNEDVPDTSIRKTKVNWLPANHIYNKILCKYVTTTNEKQYHYNLTKFTPCQFARYDVGDFYDYHQDSGQSKADYENETRKISMTVQFSDPKDYEGGEFYFYNGNKKETEPPIQEQGSILIFDSNMWHRVTPVTKGVRYSLVSWSLGPSFR
jgi:predicted 2-oxoglutarate/Fe(II)-dependent dioxygenase YbiX